MHNKLNKINSFKNIFWLLFTYLVFISSILQSFLFEGFFSYFILFISSLIFLKFISEFFHECTHWNLFFLKKINDIIGIIFLAPWMLRTLKKNRKDHFSHHGTEFYFSENDADGFILRKLFWLVGKQFPKEKINNNKLEFSINFFGVLIHLSLLFLFWQHASSIDFIIYVVTVYLIYPINTICRTLSQHFDLLDFGQTQNANNIKDTFIEKIFFNSDLMRFHEDHHRHPSHDFRRLRNNQNTLTENELTTVKCVIIFLKMIYNYWVQPSNVKANL